MTRVGEILLEHGWIDGPSLGRALAEQRHTGKRLCSLLIARGLLDPDHAARALGQQHEVAAVLQRHLENRDRSLAALLRPELARTCFALPIGRNGEGDLIVCMRDPRPALSAAIAQAIGGTVVIAVAPASQLERLIDLAYEPSPSDEYDVDMTTGPLAGIDLEMHARPGAAERHGSTPMASILRGAVASEMPDLGTMTLVELDDVRVTKDPTQSGQFATASRHPTPVPPISNVPLTIEATIAGLDASSSRDAATDLAMRFAHGRWVAALLLTIKEDAALGHRGHGSQLTLAVVQTVTIPLGAPSIVKTAHDWRRVATQPPQGAGTIQERLLKLLGQPKKPMAAPIVVGGRVAHILTVGDSIAGDAQRDLERVSSVLGEAYTRMVRDNKS